MTTHHTPEVCHRCGSNRFLCGQFDATIGDLVWTCAACWRSAAETAAAGAIRTARGYSDELAGRYDG